MKIKKILLRDEGAYHYTDLIEFRRETTLDEIVEIVYKCKNEMLNDYTNEDIYKYLDTYIGIKSIEFLDYKVVEY